MNKLKFESEQTVFDPTPGDVEETVRVLLTELVELAKAQAPTPEQNTRWDSIVSRVKGLILVRYITAERVEEIHIELGGKHTVDWEHCR